MAKKELGNNAVRLSLDWSRIFPRSTESVEVVVERDGFGNVSSVDVGEEAMRDLKEIADGKAVQRYREILSEAKETGLTVLLTLYHWPIPLWLHDPIACRDDVENADLRGWLNQRTMVEFAKYVAFEQVKRWDTESMSDLGPASVGVVCVLQYYEPYDPSNDLDVAASVFVEYVFNEWFLNSILRGDYDMDTDMLIQPDEHLPHMVKGCDFLGLNYYTRWRIRHAEKGFGSGFNFEFALCTEGCTDSGYEVYAPGLRYVIDWAYRRCRRPIYVTENGVADAGDGMRERYLLEHLGQVQSTIHEDRVPVRGYFYWSLIDNLEWSDGYKMRFGLFRVDRETKERTPTRAVPVYREIATRNGLPE